MKETQLDYCDVCDKLIIIQLKSKHFNSKSNIHKKEYGTVVKDDEYFKQEMDEVKYILSDTMKDC